MRVSLRHEWLQKHASPRSSRGDFHWFPEDGDGERRAALAARAGTGGEVLWRIEPGRVTWAASFAEVAPADRRSYVGLAVTIAEGDAPASALLAALEPVAPRPWSEEAPARDVDVIAPGPCTTAPAPVSAELARALAQGLWRGGAAVVPDPAEPALPGLWATLETWLPPSVQGKARMGSLIPPGRATVPSPGPLHHYLGLAWALPPPIAARDPALGRRAWRAAMGLAERAGISAEAIFDELELLSRSWTTAPDLAAFLARTGTVRDDEVRACDARAPAPLTAAADAGRLWSRVVHYWGRGLLAGDDLDRRLGALLARRVVADHLFHLDAPDQAALPLRYLRRLRRESIVPREAMDRLEARVAEEAPEVLHG
jgi:hypothetical protein